MIMREKFRANVLLAGLLLLSMVCVLPAAASIDENITEKNYVSVEEAKIHVKTDLYDILLIGAPGSNSTDWTNCLQKPK